MGAQAVLRNNGSLAKAGNFECKRCRGQVAEDEEVLPRLQTEERRKVRLSGRCDEYGWRGFMGSDWLDKNWIEEVQGVGGALRLKGTSMKGLLSKSCVRRVLSYGADRLLGDEGRGLEETTEMRLLRMK